MKNLTARPKYIRAFSAACLLFAAGVVHSNFAFAAIPTPTVTLSIKVVEGEPVVSVTSPSATSAQAGSTATGAKGSATQHKNSTVGSTSDTNVHLELTIMNGDRGIPTPPLVITWHLYTKTSTIANGTNSVSMNDVSGSKTLGAISPLAKLMVQSDSFDKNVTNTIAANQKSGNASNPKGGRTKGNVATTSATSTVTTLDGYYVEITYNGAVIQRTDPADKLKYEAFVKTQAGK